MGEGKYNVFMHKNATMKCITLSTNLNKYTGGEDLKRWHSSLKEDSRRLSSQNKWMTPERALKFIIIMENFKHIPK